MKQPLRLSKSRILSGLQCHRRLWLETYRRDLREVDAGQQWVFDNGNELGERARDLFAPGILIEHVDDIERAIAETQALMSRPGRRETLFEPAFAHKGVVVRADVLRPARRGYDLIEVKGSTSVKDYYIDDCASQAWVIESSGVTLSRIGLAHLDNTFVYRGKGDYRGLLHVEDITERVRERMAKVPGWVLRLRAMLRKEEPAIATGGHCDTPFGCPFQGHCRSKEPPAPKYPVSLLPRGGRIASTLMREGYRDLREVPEERLTSAMHRRVHAVTVSGERHLDPAAARQVARIPFPRHFLDFETIGFAVPRWAGTRPYQQIPFQWSCQVQSRNGSLTERAFLDLSGESPVKRFAEALLDAVGERGAIVVYNSTFEVGRITELARMLPALSARLLSLVPRVFDLLPIARDHYYHPEMMGSWSIKAILPTIAPELAYDLLGEVADGSAAQIAYVEAIQSDVTEQRRAEIAHALTRYCANDTLAMVRLVEALGGG